MKNIAERTPSISSFPDFKQQIRDSLGHLRYENQNTTVEFYLSILCWGLVEKRY